MLAPTTDAASRVIPLRSGVKTNTDRDYTVSTVPSSLEGADFFAGPIYVPAGGSLSFTLNQAGDVYLAVESGHPCLPCLFNAGEWQATGDTLQVTCGPYTIYKKSFATTNAVIQVNTLLAF